MRYQLVSFGSRLSVCWRDNETQTVIIYKNHEECVNKGNQTGLVTSIHRHAAFYRTMP